jgi:hypothetical protein
MLITAMKMRRARTIYRITVSFSHVIWINGFKSKVMKEYTKNQINQTGRSYVTYGDCPIYSKWTGNIKTKEGVLLSHPLFMIQYILQTSGRMILNNYLAHW